MSKLFEKEFEEKMMKLWEENPTKGCYLIAALLFKAVKQMNAGQLVLSGTDKIDGKEFHKWGMFFTTEHELVMKTKKVFDEHNPDED